MSNFFESYKLVLQNILRGRWRETREVKWLHFWLYDLL